MEELSGSASVRGKKGNRIAQREKRHRDGVTANTSADPMGAPGLGWSCRVIPNWDESPGL